MPKFIDDPVGTVLGGIGAGVAGLGKKLGLSGINTGSANVDPNAANNDGLLAQLYRQTQQAQAGKTPEAKSGGKVGKYSIDGIAKRGKTRAKHK